MNGTKMQAFVTAKTCSVYETLLKENQCLTIRNPSLDENLHMLKVC
ncbi:hypothetical protein HanXRQr2_Chr09g0365481 [Helianthus annuus]|uniref:Uncharacterized protein n=1 Tax=Helianthus annuus TaxID=4232 RepID=A0A9K3N6Q4_HELAN|nr:hypothetical protein HanXRQr2_Chr09g0365481 [Helianthus annuus]KAJ0891305.1 hypothetical protein HanPSC8_Chr09g0352171 [Helianthus annuus]